ncbi:hypothetical protein ACHAXT_005346 [Thalassiosira profunda]
MKASDGPEVPSFADIDHDVPIGDVYPSAIGDGQRGRRGCASQEVSSVHHASDGPIRSKRHRDRRRRRPGGEGDDGSRICDPSTAHVRTGSIIVPVEMLLPSAEDIIAGEDGDGAAPTYCINQGRVSLYAAFPPPPVAIRPKYDTGNGPIYEESALKSARRRLRQYSGFHGGVGVTSATGQAEGYCDAMLSLNYRLPSMLSPPTQLPSLVRKSQQRLFIGTLHCNLLLGSTAKPFLGTTLSALDGGTHVRWDVGNPSSLMGSSDHNRTKKGERNGERSGILLPSPQSTHTISASRTFSLASNPLRVDWAMHLSPRPPLVFQSVNQTHQNALAPLHLRHCNLTLSNNVNTEDESEGPTARPRLSLRFGYGRPVPGMEGWMHQCGSGIVETGDRSDQSNEGGKSLSSSNSASLRLDAEQRLSASQSCRSSLEYRHANQILSLSVMTIRTFASSLFSKLGVGVRYSLNNLFGGGPWWRYGSTCWLFQLERGDVRFVVPVTVAPQSVKAWESLVRLSYATLASLVVDIVVGEVLCGVRSRLRLAFLGLVLGKEKVAKYISPAENDDGPTQKDKEDWLQRHLSKAQEESARQVQLMARQAKTVASREEELGGLVVVKAIYGVMDNDSQQWLRRTGKDSSGDNANEWHALDATTQLQFWVADSSLHLPAVSKAHMLGFYDLLSFVSDDEWVDQRQPIEPGKSTHDEYPFARYLSRWKGKLWAAEKRRDLAVLLSVRYKWADKTYDVIFRDDEAVELPSQFAREVDSAASK